MKTRIKLYAVLTAAALLTGCGAFNSSESTETTTENKTTTAASDTTTDCCEDNAAVTAPRQ